MPDPSVILPTESEQLKKPPVVTIGLIAWLRENLFSTWYNLSLIHI